MANTNLNWTTKADDVDNVLAEDFNNLVTNIETEFDKKVDKVTGKGLIDTDVADNISIKNYGTNDVFTVATPEVDFKFVNAETINIPTADDIHWGTNTTLQTELDKKVGFTDYATDMKGGVIKLGADAGYTGLQLDDGVLRIIEAEDTEINRRINQHPITPVNLDYAVRSVRPNVIQNTNSEITLTCAANTIYCLGGDENVTSIALTLPATGQYGDFIQVDFFSDASSPTNLTITSNAGFTDFTLIPEGDHIYSLFFDWGMAFGDSAWGWRFNYAEYPYVANS